MDSNQNKGKTKTINKINSVRFFNTGRGVAENSVEKLQETTFG